MQRRFSSSDDDSEPDENAYPPTVRVQFFLRACREWPLSVFITLVIRGLLYAESGFVLPSVAGHSRRPSLHPTTSPFLLHIYIESKTHIQPVLIFLFFSPALRPHPTKQHAADLLLDGLADLERADVGGEEDALADIDALAAADGEAAGEALEGGQLGGDAALGGGDGGHLAHDGGVAAVLEADPEALLGDVGARERLGLERRHRRRVRRVLAAARHEGQEARAVHGQGHA